MFGEQNLSVMGPQRGQCDVYKIKEVYDPYKVTGKERLKMR